MGKESKDPTRSWCARRTCTSTSSVPRCAAIGRAGAGVNNIPVAALSKRGVPVFNAPGANANAVKELVLAGDADRRAQPRARRSISSQAAETRDDFEKRVEDGKKQFAGFELPGHTLGVIGLGKIGSLVADAAIKLGMNVLGYDPHITVEAAWSLPSQVEARRIDRRGAEGEPISSRCTCRSCEKTRHLDQREERRAACAAARCCSISRARAWWTRRRC